MHLLETQQKLLCVCVCEVPHLKCLGPKRKRQNRPIKHIKSRNNINYNINATKRAVFQVKTILGRSTSFYPRDATIVRYYLSPCVRPSACPSHVGALSKC